MLKIEKKKKNKYLLAISGGPDSMYLLNHYKNKNIIVAHVNYHKRNDSNYDQEIVESFCKKYNIPFFLLEFSNQKISENFQNWARKFRYSFFEKIYNENNCNYLLVAHHKDDFLETIFLQKNKNKKINYWGIKKKNQLFNMNIKRPFLFKKWKKSIEKYNQKKNIPYATDSSNNENIYLRNQIRINLSSKTKIWKNFIIWKYKVKNYFLLLKNYKNQKILEKWEKTNFDISFLEQQKKQKEILFLFLHKYYENLKLSDNKMEGILSFLFGKERTGSFNLGKNQKLIKKKYKIFLN